MTVHVIFGGCSFTQIYNSYANLIALANTPTEPEERRKYLNQLGFNRLQVQWQLFTSKFFDDRFFNEFKEKNGLQNYSLNIEDVAKQLFPRKEGYKFYNVAQGGGGNKLNTFCVQKAINYLRKHHPADEIKVFYNITSFDRMDKIVNKESPDYFSFIQRQKKTTSSSVWSTIPHFYDDHWNFDGDTMGGYEHFAKRKQIPPQDSIEKRSWIKFGNIVNDPQVFRLDATEDFGKWDMSGWFRQQQIHNNSEDLALENATYVNGLMDYCKANDIFCKTYFGWNTGLGNPARHGYATDSLNYLINHDNYINFAKGTEYSINQPFLGFKDWAISQFGFDLAGHQQFDNMGPFEIIVQFVANELQKHHNNQELLRKCRGNSCKTSVRGMDYIDYDDWNRKFVWEQLGPNDVIDPRTYFDAQEIDGHPSIMSHMMFGKMLYNSMI